MSDVAFTVCEVTPEPYAVTPTLTAAIDVTTTDAEPVHAIALRCQVRIDPVRRAYTDAEADGLTDLFGARERWGTTQHTFLWQHAATMVPGFTGAARVDLPLACTYDVEVAAAKYLHALHDGAVPLQFLFSGTVFRQGGRGLAVTQIPWDREDRYDLPVAVWRELVALHYPGTGWLRLRHDTIAALAAYRSAHGLLSCDDALTSLLARAVQEVP
ncbi:DUF6084 family protein [Mycolicibacterium litorale]|uniref:DUF6084 family protein n=1 Tax=Mycolicibacterium litorale TaxID=758802 RepID=UPI003CEB8CBC